MFLERLTALLGADDPKTRLSKIRAFQLILLLHHGAGVWNDALLARGQWNAETALQLVGVSGACLLGLVPRFRRGALAALALLALEQVWSTFPLTSNHLLLEFLFPALAAFFTLEREEEQELFLLSTRGLLVIVLFYSGLQKVVHGFYFRGEFFSYLVATDDRFRSFFQGFLPTAEVERLLSYKLAVGDGPYRADSAPLVLMSNATYLLEMTLAGALTFPRTREAAVAATALVVVLIQLAAREIFFGALFLNVLLLFLRADLNRKLIPAFTLLYAWALLMRLHLLPEIVFH